MTDITLGEETLTTFRQALERVSAIAHAKLPAELHGNLERATALVLGRHVWMDEGGKHAQVLSSDGHDVVPRERQLHLHGRRARPAGPVQAPPGRRPVPPRQRAARRVHARRGDAVAPALPEAPASVNVRLCIGGAEVQWTLRDVDEDRLAERLQALLTRFPQTTKATQDAAHAPTPEPQSAPVCAVHGPLKQSTKAPGTWFCSKKNFDGSYCQSRHPAK